MNTSTKTTQLNAATRATVYQGLALAELIARIVHDDDRVALQEFHDHRPVFKLNGSSKMRLVPFVGALSTSPWALRLTGHDEAVMERACDDLIDKFFHLPPDRRPEEGLTHPGPDCRRYFGAALRALDRWKDGGAVKHPLQEEAAAAQILQRGVVKHFRLSCLEARRHRDPTRSRYAWHVNGGVLRVWMPVAVPRQERRNWLETHVERPDTSRPGERRRVQAIIDDHFGFARHVSLTSCAAGSPTAPLCDDPVAAAMTKERLDCELGNHIAEEKAQKINEQRPAVRRLGPDKLRTLIQLIFQGIASSRYREGRLARAFGLSKATFSRFAGSRWRAHGRIPDLWRNTAGVLAHHRPFVETIREAGLWDEVDSLLRDDRPSAIRRSDDA